MSLFGYDQGVFSKLIGTSQGLMSYFQSNYLGGVVITQDFLEVHDLVGPSKTKDLSTVTAIYDIGCFFGAIIAFTIGERLGK